MILAESGHEWMDSWDARSSTSNLVFLVSMMIESKLSGHDLSHLKYITGNCDSLRCVLTALLCWAFFSVWREAVSCTRR
jgi:hypothetical protein